MFAIIGLFVVIGSVLGGFALEGGPFLVLMQFAEFIIILGAAVGALLISAPTKLLSKIVSRIIAVLKGESTSRKTYLDLLKLLYELFHKSQKDGLMGLEKHIEKPESSEIFSKYPDLMKKRSLILFLTDTCRLVIVGGVAPHDLEGLMDGDIETHQHENRRPGMILQKIADSLPGLGIVAAVLGIVITMQAIDGPAQEIGHKVAAALVGTFLGIFVSYGFLQPLSTNIDIRAEEDVLIFEVMKSALTALAKGLKPIVCIEFARRSIPEDLRPEYDEMESYVKGAK